MNKFENTALMLNVATSIFKQELPVLFLIPNPFEANYFDSMGDRHLSLVTWWSNWLRLLIANCLSIKKLKNKPGLVVFRPSKFSAILGGTR